ncbi:MAG: cell division protein ZipA C-terminal FtsZ-binding domain-containing protein, partial [Methylococcaceae bacterium]|nr:cell division protein ZipA C-terminal FtsZ-binding domain-containing protein [Methylococcaceae bacterium]
IQFSLVSNQDEGFNGLDLAHAFEIVGLEYGNLNIYERLDSNRMVDFGVASMVPPGTFPEQDLETYYCPGIVFFMQPGELEDAVSVFDDFVQTVVFMATELDGTVLDHEHKPLSETTVELIRRSL